MYAVHRFSLLGFPQYWLYCSSHLGVVDVWEPIYSSRSKSSSLYFRIFHQVFFHNTNSDGALVSVRKYWFAVFLYVTEQKLGGIYVSVLLRNLPVDAFSATPI